MSCGLDSDRCKGPASEGSCGIAVLPSRVRRGTGNNLCGTSVQSRPDPPSNAFAPIIFRWPPPLLQPNSAPTYPFGSEGREDWTAHPPRPAPSTTREFLGRVALPISLQRQANEDRAAAVLQAARTRFPPDCRAGSDETPPPPESTLARKSSPRPATPATPLPSAHVPQRILRRGSIAAPRQVLRESNQVSSPRHHFERMYVSPLLFVM